MISTYRVRRRQLVGKSYREGGELFPEGHLIRRVESMVHTGGLVEVKVEEDEFLEALDAYVSDEAQRREITERVGLENDLVERGPHKTPGPKVITKAVPIQPEDKPPSQRLSGPVKPKPVKLPTKRISKAKAAKRVTAKKQSPAKAPAEKPHRRTNDGEDKVNLVPLRKLDE